MSGTLFAKAEREVISAAVAALEPRPLIARSAWCAENLYLPAETSATPGPYDLTRYAYLREPLDAVDDPEVEMIVLCWATQLGKTTLLQAVLASQAMLAPVPAMLGSADKDSMIELRDKFYALAEASPAVAPSVPDERLRNNRWIDVGGMRCHLAYAYNTQRLSGKSCGLVVCTEVDRWRKTKSHGDPFETISQRVKAFHRWKIVAESTPSDENSRIYRLYEQSDRRRFLVPCPHCGHWQELRFFPLKKGPFAGHGGVLGILDGQGRPRSADEVMRTAYYACEQGCRIVDGDKPKMVRAGRWVPKGQRVNADGELEGKPLRTSRIWGARLSSLYAETISFGRVAAKWIQSRDRIEELQVFYNDWLSLRWRRRAKTIAWQELHRRLQGNHRPGVVPPWAYFLTAGVDVGKNNCRYVVRAWGEGGRSALVEWGVTRRSRVEPPADATAEERERWLPESRLGHLLALEREIIQRRFYLPAGEKNPSGVQGLAPALVGVDCGFEPHLVHEFWVALGASRARVRQLRGVAEIKGGERWRSRVVERDARTGKPYEGGQEQWDVSRAFFCGDVQSRWKLAHDAPAAWLLTSAPLSECEVYLKEVVNEAPQQKPNKYGRMRKIWCKVNEGIGNHYWDCEVYAAALADMVVGGDWRGLAAKARQPGPTQRADSEEAYLPRRSDDDYSAR